MTPPYAPRTYLSKAFTRSPVHAIHGLVATNHPQASEIGLRILKQGGNATDAAIAIAATLALVEPCSTGMGGDCFLLHYDAATKKVSALNGSGRNAQALTLERARKDCPGRDSLALDHVHSITVPGAVAGWVDAIDSWGSLSVEEVLRPVIDLAKNGFPLSSQTAAAWKRGVPRLKQWPHPEALLVDGDAPGVGEIFRNLSLASTLEEVAVKGKAGFYQGRVAEAIVASVRAQGGVLSLEDLKNHTSTFVDPIKASFGGVDVYEVPPNGQGITALIALNLLNEIAGDEWKKEHNSVEYLHTLIEVLRLAFTDARWYVADPTFSHVPVEELLSATYAKTRVALIDPDKAAVDPIRGSPVLSSGTVSFQVVDGAGNAVSMVNSNYAGFGTGLIPQGLGFTLQNRGANFSLVDGHPNVLAPGKRPYHTIIPALSVYTDSQLLHSTFTVMGGFMQPQGHVQVLLNQLLFRMDPQAALDVPRFCIGTPEGDFSYVYVEPGVDEAVVDALRAKGHAVRVLEPAQAAAVGRGQIITKNPRNGVLCAGSDGRGDGLPMGW
ncbi:gamma-glutamyltransferase [Aphanomyces invadans]|uniref:Gamma-glutamyltransferase n=1 Tax=Aphanomyces invadans TaxID=157072 RepID=A0A024U5M2_9STRA|nr:gamma-glutamyltransferase [Aphanomyces invadans]ETW01564.1 gamma-glutamyltransferase [Aphanomyces invadans]|eukprot:XP_008869412.1 gamma-glutamyltransferase [Aphanomyces invadans]